MGSQSSEHRNEVELAKVSARAKPLTGAAVQPRCMSPHRAEAAAQFSRILRDAMTETRTSAEQLARALDLSASQIAHWTDPDDPQAMTMRDVLAMRARCPSLYAAIVRRLAALGDEQPRSGRDVTDHALAIAAEAGDVARVAAAAMRDGRVDDDERRELLRELAEARAAIDAAARDLEVGR